MSEKFSVDIEVPSSTTAFDTAAAPQFESDEHDHPVQQVPKNGRTEGRYARQGITPSDCRYGC